MDQIRGKGLFLELPAASHALLVGGHARDQWWYPSSDGVARMHTWGISIFKCVHVCLLLLLGSELRPQRPYCLIACHTDIVCWPSLTTGDIRLGGHELVCSLC